MATFLAEEIVAIFNRLRGSKTFYAALLAIAAATHGYLDGKLTPHQALVAGSVALVGLGLRDALAKLSPSAAKAVDVGHVVQLLAHFDPPPAVAMALEHHGVPVAKLQQIFKTACEFSDLGLPPVQAPGTSPPPTA